jgi:hypothetical protein
MYSTIIYGKGRNESLIKVREIRGQKQNGAQEDKYRYQQSYNYRGYQKKSGCKYFITSWLHIEKNEPEMFTANKIYGKYQI